MILLAADLGGTKTMLVMVRLNPGREILREQSFQSGDFDSLEAIVKRFLKPGENIDAACLAVAGPVSGNEAKVTNLPWRLSEAALCQALPFEKVRLINDFAAVGYGIPLLTGEDVMELQKGQPDLVGPIAVMGAGTGLGQALLLHDGKRYQVLPTEGGHAHFAPENRHQDEILIYMRKRFPRVSKERLLSGAGISALYDYYRNAADGNPHDPAQVTELARQGEKTAMQAMDCFWRLYGQAAGDLALSTLCRGGFYIAGGIAAKNRELLEASDFLNGFNDKGRMSEVARNIPVRVIANRRVGLLGALEMAERMIAV